jgi:hypothetical protein
LHDNGDQGLNDWIAGSTETLAGISWTARGAGPSLCLQAVLAAGLSDLRRSLRPAFRLLAKTNTTVEPDQVVETVQKNQHVYDFGV